MLASLTLSTLRRLVLSVLNWKGSEGEARHVGHEASLVIDELLASLVLAIFVLLVDSSIILISARQVALALVVVSMFGELWPPYFAVGGSALFDMWISAESFELLGVVKLQLAFYRFNDLFTHLKLLI